MLRVDRTDGYYSRAEQVSDATIHVLGVGMGLIGAATLIPLAILWGGEARIIAAASIYAMALVAMLLASACYNMSAEEAAWKDWLRRIDHTAIYLKIAGTYTPFVILSGIAPGVTLMFLWTAAGIGGALRILAPGRYRWLCLALYLVMGWSGVVIGTEMFGGLGPTTFNLMLIGGLLYTGGVVFFLWESLPFHYTIWHAFVLVATIFFYTALVVELAGPGIGVIAKL